MNVTRCVIGLRGCKAIQDTTKAIQIVVCLEPARRFLSSFFRGCKSVIKDLCVWTHPFSQTTSSLADGRSLSALCIGVIQSCEYKCKKRCIVRATHCSVENRYKKKERERLWISCSVHPTVRITTKERSKLMDERSGSSSRSMDVSRMYCDVKKKTDWGSRIWKAEGRLTMKDAKVDK
jgi:hypothetical protein